MTSSISHHPDAVTLVDYATGALAPSLAAVVATHLLLCSKCRMGVRTLEAVGGALLDGRNEHGAALPPAPVPATRASEAATPGDSVQGLPRAALEAFGLGEAIPWKPLGLGVRHCRIRTGLRGGDLRLMKIAPGTAVPEHGHGGTELTLVLAGAFADATGTYRRGDVQDVDGDVEHQPRVTPDAECICLVASVAPARFTTLVGRLSQYWTGL